MSSNPLYTKPLSSNRPTKDGLHPKTGKPVCGGKRRSDGMPCMQIAGWGTTHTGQGYCKIHGGAAHAANVTHGRYSKIQGANIADTLKWLKENDSDPLDLSDDLLLLRALAMDFISRYTEFADALISWNQSWMEGDGTARKPTKILDITAASSLVRDVTRTVKLIHDIRNNSSVSLTTFNKLMQEMGKVVVKHCDDNTLRRIEAEWGSIRVSDRLPPSNQSAAGQRAKLRLVSAGSKKN